MLIELRFHPELRSDLA